MIVIIGAYMLLRLLLAQQWQQQMESAGVDGTDWQDAEIASKTPSLPIAQNSLPIMLLSYFCIVWQVA